MSSARNRASRWHRLGRLTQALLPAVGAIAAVVVAVWTFFAFTAVFPGSGYWQRIFSTLITFAGGYTAPGKTAVKDAGDFPPTSIAIPATLAFAITIAAAASVVVVLSRRARNAIRVWLAHPRLAVLGNGPTATAIITSAIENEISVVLVTHSETSESHLAARGTCPTLIVPNLDAVQDSPGLIRIAKRAQNVVVATESSSENLRIRQALRRHRPGAAELDDFRSLMAVVSDPRLAEALRPTTLRRVFAEEDVTCPSENVAEHVCHVIDAAATGSRAVRKGDDGQSVSLVERVAVQVVDVASAPGETEAWADLAATVELWVRRLTWGRIFLNGDERADGMFNPIVPVEVIPADQPLPTDGSLTVRVYAGSPTRSVSALLRDRVADPAATADLTVLVADRIAAQAAANSIAEVGKPLLTGRQWMKDGAVLPEPVDGPGARGTTTVVVDPVAIGLDANLVVDAITLQWARMFAQTYNFMFAGDYSIIAWEPGAPLAERLAAEEREAAKAAREKAMSEHPGIAGSDGETEYLAAAEERARVRKRKEIGNRYSCRKAVQNMLLFLDDPDLDPENEGASGGETGGYELVRVAADLPRPPVAPCLSDDDVVKIAGLEHDDWRRREWLERRPLPGIRRWLTPDKSKKVAWRTADFSASGVRDFTLAELERSPEEIYRLAAERGIVVDDDFKRLVADFPRAANYNRRIVTETYPAIAAAFGYAIVRKNHTAFPAAPDDDASEWWVFPRRPNEVTAEKQSESWTWTTSGGDEMTGGAGDWLVTDQWGARRSVTPEDFERLYEPVPSGRENRYRRIGSVRARPARPGETVVSKEGPTVAREGDWVVQGDTGDRWCVPGVDFSRGYVSSGGR
ncbi:MAG: hypothetical protein QM809_04650 [Gordonia sp. (in: high G+C Gram-positive bacteria)]|uniref:hypothetical protein n=1 Tax=Gordonia sp. (in: high G+C Gram-positive bacteria) TaxID=84139 RepID=UPI0039E3959C